VWETGLKASARTLCVVFKSLGYVPCAEALAPTSYSRCCWAPRGGAWHVERARTWSWTRETGRRSDALAPRPGKVRAGL